MKYILDEPIISFYPTAAIALGSSDRALVFQQLNFLLAMTEKDKREYNFVNGHWWVYNTYAQWKSKYFPWMSEDTIQRIFLFLEEKKIVLSMQSVKNPSDRTKWYSIDEKVWEAQISSLITANCDHASPQTATMIITANCDDDSSESPSEITKDLPPLAAAALPLVGIRSFQAPDTKVSEGDEPALKKGRKKSQPELAMIVMSIYDKTRMSAENLAAFQAECDLYSTDPIYKGWFDMICRPTLTFTDANGKLVRKKIPEVIELIQMHIGLDKYRQNHSGIAESSATQEVIEDQDWMSKVYEPKSPSAL